LPSTLAFTNSLSIMAVSLLVLFGARLWASGNESRMTQG
jgi:hypothetical protein